MIKFDRIITAHDLLKRWPGCLDQELAMIVTSDQENPHPEISLQGYWYAKTLAPPPGKHIHYCQEEAEPEVFHTLEGIHIEWDGAFDRPLVFNMLDVERIENEHPDFKYEMVSSFEPAEPHEPTKQTVSTRTAKATEQRRTSVANIWERQLTTAVSMAVQCFEYGPKERTESELKTMLETMRFDLSARALKAFKKAMPSTHVKKTPGAPKQE